MLASARNSALIWITASSDGARNRLSATVEPSARSTASWTSQRAPRPRHRTRRYRSASPSGSLGVATPETPDTRSTIHCSDAARAGVRTESPSGLHLLTDALYHAQVRSFL